MATAMTTLWSRASSSYLSGSGSNVKPMPAGQKQGKISLITSKCFTTQLGAIVTTMGFLRYDLSSSTKRGWQVSRILIAIQGDFESLSSIASVKVTSELPSAKEEAVSIATVRARRQISEFLNTEVNSERFVTTVTKTLQDSVTITGENSMTLNSKIANEVKETIRQKSSALLKGTFVESEVYDPNTKSITVIVKTGVKESGISKTVRKLMN